MASAEAALPKLFADLDRALAQATYEKASDICAASTAERGDGERTREERREREREEERGEERREREREERA